MPIGRTVGSKLMSRHGPSRSGWICCTVSVPTSTAATVLWPRLARIRGGIVRIGDGHHHGPAKRPTANALGDLLLKEVRAALSEIIGRDRNGLRRRQQRPAHRMFSAGTIDENEGVKAVEAVFGVAARPRGALGPCAERRDLRMRAGKCLHRARVLARRGEQQLVKCLRRRHGKEWGIDHGGAPFLPVRVGIRSPMPLTRTVASGAFGSAVPRLKRPSAGYWPRVKTASPRERRPPHSIRTCQ